jgi:hypothetical protein
MIIGDPREGGKIEKNSGREIVLKRSTDGRENIKITIKSSGHGRQAKAPVKKARRCYYCCPRQKPIRSIS